MFAMVFERDPLRLQDVPVGLVLWVQNVGGWAAAGLLLWLLLGYSRMRGEDRARIPPWQKTLFLVFVLIAAVGYLLFGGATVISSVSSGSSQGLQNFRAYTLTVAGAGALLAVLLPFAVSMASLRLRRVGALARLSFKEAIRSRALYAFSFLLLVFLFASWFVPYKPENQVRTYVGVINWPMTLLLLLVAVIVTAFSIPNDIRRQTIHTITTKPVERFEIVLGRFLGFTALMTLVLLVMATVSVIYVLRGIDPAAADESLKAREPLYGELRYENTTEGEGTNVGREWNYRRYITANSPGRDPQYAVWDFPSVPRALAERKQVRCEFTFDIYRTTKGTENQGVSCQVEFLTAHFDKSQREAYNKERGELRGQADADDRLAEKYGYYVVAGKSISDFHTEYLDVPGGLFRNAFQSAPARAGKGEAPPPLQVRVSVNRQSATQYVGMAKYDLYWRLDEPRPGGEKAAFTYNFYKGMLGLWFRLCLVIGLAVALSTYLSGVISMLVAGLLYLGGMVIDFIQQIAFGVAPGGGPMEALVRLANRQVALMPLEEESAGSKVANIFDPGFRWLVRRVLDLVPDVSRYDLSTFVAEGFNIPVMQLLITFGMLLMYLLPWIVLAYYLIKWREIAAPT